jgi:hypothetical protein
MLVLFFNISDYYTVLFSRVALFHPDFLLLVPLGDKKAEEMFLDAISFRKFHVNPTGF